MCGIVGILSHQPVAAEIYDSLVHLQHRGQDAAGILTCDRRFHSHIGHGLVREIFNKDNLQRLHGNAGIGHARYPTAGAHSQDEIQPFWTGRPLGIAWAHNGNVVNQAQIIKQLQQRNLHLNSTSDSEMLMHLFANSLESNQGASCHDDQTFFDKLCIAFSDLAQQVQGSYSVVSLIIGRGLVAFRDPHGIRPLVMGRRHNQDQPDDFIFASEPTMHYSLGFHDLDDVQPGELVFVSFSGQIFRKTIARKAFNPCIFEYVYFARPDAMLDHVSVYRARLRMGQNLAKRWQERYGDELPDIVIPAPFTANTAALSFAHELNVRYSEGLYKNPFIGRTFIMPNTQQRKQSVRYKLTPQATEIKNKKVLIVDDSIVRGTTSKEIIKMVRENGAKAVYFASACPPIKHPCYYGIDMPTEEELIAAYKSEQQVADYLGADKLIYQTIDDLVEAVTRRGDHHIDHPCLACMDGRYLHGCQDGLPKNLSKTR